MLRVWQRLAWLEEDLQRVETPRSAAPAVPFSLASLGEGLGSLYVIEGSALGEQVIFQKAADALRVSAERGGRYFHGHGHYTAAVWADFLRVLNAVPPWSAAGDQAEVGARRTFELFAAVMRTRHLAAR